MYYSPAKSEKPSYSVLNDISLGGLNLTSEESLSKAESIKITVYLADNTIDCQGKVVWQDLLPDVEIYHMGIQFMHMDSPTRKTLSNFLQNLVN